MCIRDSRITDTTAYPNSAICYMEMKFPDDDGLYVGTAWMYGERVAMTAGHCVCLLYTSRCV